MNDFVFKRSPYQIPVCTVRIGSTTLEYRETQSYEYQDGVLTADRKWFMNDSVLFERYCVCILDCTKTHDGDDGLRVYLLDADTHTEITSQMVSNCVLVSSAIVRMIAEHEHWTTRDYVQRGLLNTMTYTIKPLAYTTIFGSVFVFTSALGDAFFYQFNVGDFSHEESDDHTDYDDDHVRIVKSKMFYLDEVIPSLQHLISVVISSIKETSQ
jgi:hypothetical protein